jgi:putative endonuclease
VGNPRTRTLDDARQLFFMRKEIIKIRETKFIPSQNVQKKNPAFRTSRTSSRASSRRKTDNRKRLGKIQPHPRRRQQILYVIKRHSLNLLRMCETKRANILMNKSWFVYILECQDGSFYTGVTNDLSRRMAEHAKGKGSKYVTRKKFKRLLKSKECKNRSDAQKAEYHIKTLSKWDKLDWFN